MANMFEKYAADREAEQKKIEKENGESSFQCGFKLAGGIRSAQVGYSEVYEYEQYD